MADIDNPTVDADPTNPATPPADADPAADPAADDTDTDTGDTDDDGDEPDDDTETFPREYVEKLRGQNAKYRDRAKTAEGYANRLHTELVRATGRLADPTDLPFDADHLEDSDALTEAIDELLEAKPHLASRRPAGDIGQGARGPAAGSFSLLDMLKART